ncbi:hypothetical protein [Pseudomonas protegens]|uniref:hypothetical protein n=1 Tax=Pseudomonas protegens TaxID=380021 RepID=UPI0024C2E59C|nr:hypothetical protein [Pseudomonas protegens]MDK1397490.1 hypothetical protein [Pseudomonas protegens]
MKLRIEFPEDLRTEQLLRQVRIPCLCKISENFEICFSDTVPESSGIVLEWDRKELESRAVAGGGGQYTHYANSLITLKDVGSGVYQIIDLDMFYTRFGWCEVLKNGEYASPGDFWDEE